MDVVQKRNTQARNLSSLLLFVIALSSCSQSSTTASSYEFRNNASCAGSAIPNRFLVRWKNGSTTVEKAASQDEFKSEFLEKNKNEIEFAEPDYKVHLPESKSDLAALSFVDPYWGHEKIEAELAWENDLKGGGVVVAVIDSGVEISHPQLKNQIAVNMAEIAGNGIDDDQNGYIDDVYGYDFAVGSGNVGDTSGHGTHVSGIILAEHAVGPAKGIAPEAKLLALDFMDGEGGHVSDAIDAIRYAVARGAKIINASWGGGLCSESLRTTIAGLKDKGVLFVAAAGNSGNDLDWVKEYPAAFASDAQITVGASTSLDARAEFSNYSWSLANIFAPGALIMSTYKGGTTTSLSGTSMAAPFVSGAAAVIWGHRPTATLAQIREAIFASVDRDPSEPRGSLPSTTGGRLNLRKAIEKIEQFVP